MVDVIVAIIAIFYGGQAIDLVLRNYNELIRFPIVYVLLLALLPSFIISRELFVIILFFFLIMWGKINRSESWGIEYITLLIFQLLFL